VEELSCEPPVTAVVNPNQLDDVALHPFVRQQVCMRPFQSQIVIRANELFESAIAGPRLKTWFKSDASAMLHGSKGYTLVLACLQQAVEESSKLSGHSVHALLSDTTSKLSSVVLSRLQKSRFFILMICKS
jgi:hypothetical protein